jgi:hypothetical protein
MAAFGAGVGPCGHDPEDALVGATKQEAVSALYFDPYERAYTQNADYSMVGGSGPIQRAAHLLLPLGAIPAVSGSGFDTGAVKRASPAARLTVIEDGLRRTWRTLLETKQISMGPVRLVDSSGRTWESGPWGGLFEVPVYDLVNQAKSPVPLRGRVA